jgi:hypothetical protein
MEGFTVLGPRQKHVAILVIERREGADEAASIGADPGVLEVASVESDRIRQNKLPGGTGGGARSPRRASEAF